jgi:aspartate/methionine/tyrosine aminotransferase
MPPTIAHSSRLARLDAIRRPGSEHSVRDLDLSLRLDGGSDGLLDTTHFDTVRFPPPAWAGPAIAAAVADGSLAYTAYRGSPGVIEELAPRLAALTAAPVALDEIVVTPGTQGALFTLLAATVGEGDVVMVADPEYLFPERMLTLLGARVERVPLLVEGGHAQLDVERIEQLLPLSPRLLLFSNPSNPTGALYSRQSLEEIAALAERGDFLIVADELYSRLNYEGAVVPMRSIDSARDRTVTVLGPSKTESLSGFRIGVALAPPAIAVDIERVLAITSLRAPAYSQQLLRHWLADDIDFVRDRIVELRALREITYDALASVPGVVVDLPPATAYMFPDVSALGVDDFTIAQRMQRDAGVIVSPGYQFGDRGVGRFRVCYARDEVEWRAALDRMVAVLRSFSGAEAPA